MDMKMDFSSVYREVQKEQTEMRKSKIHLLSHSIANETRNPAEAVKNKTVWTMVDRTLPCER